MTSNSLPAMLDAVLDPLASIQEQVQAAAALARRMKLPAPFIVSIEVSAAALDGIHHNLLDIAVVLDPDLAKHQP